MITRGCIDDYLDLWQIKYLCTQIVGSSFFRLKRFNCTGHEASSIRRRVPFTGYYVRHGLVTCRNDGVSSKNISSFIKSPLFLESEEISQNEYVYTSK